MIECAKYEDYLMYAEDIVEFVTKKIISFCKINDPLLDRALILIQKIILIKGLIYVNISHPCSFPFLLRTVKIRKENSENRSVVHVFVFFSWTAETVGWKQLWWLFQGLGTSPKLLWLSRVSQLSYQGDISIPSLCWVWQRCWILVWSRANYKTVVELLLRSGVVLRRSETKEERKEESEQCDLYFYNRQSEVVRVDHQLCQLHLLKGVVVTVS